MIQTRSTLFISHSSKDKAWAEGMRDRLRGEGYGTFLDSHPDDGIHPGANWEKTLWRRLRQSGGVVVLCSADWLASPWCVAEAMIAREYGKTILTLATADVADGRPVPGSGDTETKPTLPGFLKDTQFISLAGLTDEEVYRRLWRGLAEEGLNEDFPVLGPPYPGLEPLQERDAAVFFGRKDEIERVREVLNQRRLANARGFILILGASGCGKSSLVRAGVLPRLRRPGDGENSGATWVILPPLFGREGLEGLALSLATAFKEAGKPSQLETVRTQIAAAREQGGGAEALQKLANDLLFANDLTDAHVLLVLDQLEEVFATAEGSDARAMLLLLLDAGADPASRIVVLATLRSDFLNAFQQFEGTADRYEKITLDPMQKERFAEIIEGPAKVCGFRLEEALTPRLVEDTRYGDALPLLAFTLKELYEKGGADNLLTLEEYEGLFPAVPVRAEDGTKTTEKGVSAAIKHVADQILEATGYLGLPANAPRLQDLRSAFFRLAEVGQEGQFTRRTARRSDMPDSVDEVLGKFESQRLLVPGADADGEPTLSVAHEALFRVWDTLRGWLLQDRKALALRTQIEDAAAEWDDANRAESRAWPEERVVDAVREIELSGVSLDDVSHRDAVDAFLGPTDPDEIATLPALTETEDEEKGSGRYGDAWRLPLNHQARASAGVRLDLLGDRRLGVGLRDGLPDIDWVWIDGGEVTVEIRSDPNDPNSEIKERLTRAVEPFSMARYPLTITQFRAFLQDCYLDDQWRLPPGFPMDLNAADWPPPKHRARHGNHPADNVNWVDAAAFCHWLSDRRGQEIVLPTEFQWQLAATGGDPSRTYPWSAPPSPDWDPQQEPWRANTVESELVRSTAVGMYPAGVSAAGIADMAGTLWEWCLNAFEDIDNVGFPGSPQDLRVLRGGSWYSYQVYARSAYRNGDNPYYRNNFVGFRVVCSAPSLDTDH
jgi:formylglycine-generating enzyme required for sulfatase activity